MLSHSFPEALDRWVDPGNYEGEMKLSNRCRYATLALFDIAFHNDGKPTQVRQIAKRQDIPGRFLEQIFHDLRRALGQSVES